MYRIARADLDVVERPVRMMTVADVKQMLKSQAKFAAVFALGLALYLGAPEHTYAFESAKFAIKELCGHMMGNLGALLMTTAGVGAIVSAAFGNFKASYSLIITGIGAFSVSSMLSLYFPDAGTLCEEGSSGGSNRTINFDMPAVPLKSKISRTISNPELAIAAGQTVDFSRGAQLDLADEDVDDDKPQDDDDTNTGNAKNLKEFVDLF